MQLHLAIMFGGFTLRSVLAFLYMVYYRRYDTK